MNKTNRQRTMGLAAMAAAFSLAQTATAESPSITTGGDAEWTEASAGCWRSGAITNDQSSWIEFAVADAPCGVSFQWKASSESGCDYLAYYVDGMYATSISGEMEDWASGSLLVAEPGSHQIRFEYYKDSSVSDGEDCGCVKAFAAKAVSVRTLALDANGGGEDLSGLTVADGYAVGALPDTVWTGEGTFRFLGWFTEKEGGDQVTAASVCQAGWTTLFAHWKELHPPANDDFAGAETIVGTSGSVGGTTIDSTWETPDLIPWSFDSSYSSTVWYQWKVPENGNYVFSVADADPDRGWSAAVGLTPGGAVEYDENGDAYWPGAVVNEGQISVRATTGAVYWIEVGSDSDEGFDFTLSWQKLAVPVNDDFDGATVISGAVGSVKGTLINSTREPIDLLSDAFADFDECDSTVWYQWTAPGDGVYAFTVLDADENRVWAAVGVTTGYDGQEGTWGGAQVDWSTGMIRFHATTGVTYWIEVGMYSGSAFDFTLSWKRVIAPANDDFADAEAISGASGSVEGTTIDSTRELNDLLPDTEDSPNSYCNSTVWYRWTAPEDGIYAFAVADSGSGIYGNEIGVTTGYDDAEGTWLDAHVNGERTVVNVSTGVTYWIEVGNYWGYEFDFTLSWKKLHSPANDNFDAAATISGATGSVGGTTIDSTSETPDLIFDRYGSSGSTVWYRWTAPEDGFYAFSVADADGERGGEAAVGVTTGYDGEEGTWADANVGWLQITFATTANVTYWIEVGANDEFDFTLSWKKLHPPTNDNFKDATTISGVAGSIEGTTIDSTRESPDLIPDADNYSFRFCYSTVWYQWTAPEDGFYAFSVPDADEGRGGSAAVGVTTGYNDEVWDWSCVNLNWQRATVQATKGDSYWIEVGSDFRHEFDFTLSWERVPAPANDHFADAIEVEGVSGRTTGSNEGASVEEGEPLPNEKEDGMTFATTASVWWRWKAPEDGSFTVSTEGSDFDTVLGIYTGTSVDGLSTVAAHDGSGVVGTSSATFAATEGTIYYFAVGGYKSNAGDIVLSWNHADDTGDVVVDAGDGKTVTVPGTWLAEHPGREATDTAANGRLKVWQCYVLGLDPEGPEDFRIVSFPMKADGMPDWEHIEVSPNPSTWAVPATLQLKGAETLNGTWIDVPGAGDAVCRFVAAEVVLP